MFNVFICAPTKAGKTTIAKYIAEKLEFNYLPGSEWVRSTFTSDTEYEDRDEFVKDITAHSMNEMLRNPNVCVDFIKSKYPIEKKNYIIEGLRSPYDFINLFDRKTDIVFNLEPLFGRDGPEYQFEKCGLDAIRSYTKWMLGGKLIKPVQAPRVEIVLFNKDSDPVKAKNHLDDRKNDILNTIGVYQQLCR